MPVCKVAAIAAEVSYPLSSGTGPYREFQEGLEGLRRETEHLLTWPGLADFLQNDPELGRGVCAGGFVHSGNRKHAPWPLAFCLLIAGRWDMLLCLQLESRKNMYLKRRIVLENLSQYSGVLGYLSPQEGKRAGNLATRACCAGGR